MQKNKWFFLGLVFLIISFSSHSLGQEQLYMPFKPPPPTIPYHKTMEIFRNGINLIITVDSFSQKWGILKEPLEDAAQTGVKAAGWEFNPASDRSISVSIDSLKKSSDSFYVFKIEAERIRKTIALEKDKPELLIGMINQLVYSIATQIRKDIIRDNMNRPDPDYSRKRWFWD
jgi:hypothetical protein